MCVCVMVCVRQERELDDAARKAGLEMRALRGELVCVCVCVCVCVRVRVCVAGREAADGVGDRAQHLLLTTPYLVAGREAYSLFHTLLQEERQRESSEIERSASSIVKRAAEIEQKVWSSEQWWRDRAGEGVRSWCAGPCW